MKRALSLLLITSTIGAGSMVNAGGQGPSLAPEISLASRAVPGADLTLIDDDADEDSGWLWSWSDDEDDDDCEDDHDEGGDDCAGGSAGNPAKAGTVAPPKNGLFTDGIAPVVTLN